MTDEKNNLFPDENQNAADQEGKQNQSQPSYGTYQNANGQYFYTQNGVPYGQGNAPLGQGPEKKPKKPGNRWGIIAALALLYVVLVGGLFYLISSGVLRFQVDMPSGNQTEEEKKDQEKTEEKEDNAPIREEIFTNEGGIDSDPYTGEGLTAVQLYESNVDSVVFVEANYRYGTATGSGFIVDSENGYILTNHHVVKECEDIAVTMKNGDSYTAKLIGGDEINDVAVLKVEAKDLKHVTLGDSDKIKVGQEVLIIGNPLGDLTFTLTKGIVSAVDRTINTGEHNIKTFQTDTAINSGNSGGPAFDTNGSVIGIASAKYSASGVEGIGFCIPINDAMAIARDLVEHGYVTGRPNFGITVSDSLGYEYTTDSFGRRVRVETALGARVEEVGKDSCAMRGGIQVGDIITKLDDVKIETANQLINAKNSHKAGDTVTLEVYRKGEKVTLTVTLDEYTP